ncbi:folate-binding protein [Curvibacter sp. RS43]|uniref:CAF17-like 4Fe-4S cluster assembly/insertion protein YgfZ n=1 Tax=Curvibacter microcysteis TaxID=3026419 RepID=UPI00235E2F6E|nr:folate-binding protein [Curvibacter sp. RS43]MDD0810023.1 folate-binding protein [Curvibacter sp. RS43]
MTQALNSPAALLHGVAPLPQWGVIRALGEDAASFLHGQLTQDLLLLPDGQARLAGYCSAKGRLLATFVVLRRSASELWLACPLDVLPGTLKRLSMFVLRAKVKLSDASAELAVRGLAGSALTSLGLNPASAPWQAQALGAGHAVALYPAAGVARALWIGPTEAALPTASALPTLSDSLWAWSEVQSAVPHLGLSQADAFVPQMLNYESVGGVNFKKGCYPGQEVVARSQFRGTLKRRTCLAHGVPAGGVAPGLGQELFLASDAPDQPTGVVVQCAAAPAGGFDVLAVVQVGASVAGQALHLGAPDGPAFEVQALPYALLEDI